MDNKFNDRELSDKEIKEITEDTQSLLKNLEEASKSNEKEPVIVYDAENDKDVEVKQMNVLISDTGEKKILGEVNSDEKVDTSIDNVLNIIDTAEEVSEEDSFDNIPIEEKDLAGASDTMFGDLAGDTDFSKEDITALLALANRRIKKEKFNVYRELPDSMKGIIDKYASSIPGVLSSPISEINRIKKMVAEEIIDDFISNIQFNKAKSDFATDLEKIYKSSTEELSEASINLIEERNNEYRKAADKLEDEEKKAKLLSILDRIDEARALTELKEYAKNCKIKKYDRERPDKVYNDFLNLYRNSTNNIYDIKLARNCIIRNMKELSESDVDLFLITFCKQVRLYNVDNMLHHSYMYYVLYYAAMLDGDKSDTFKNNIKEVIANVKKRNNIE